MEQTDEKTDPGIVLPPRPAAKMPDLGALASLVNDPTITEIMVNDLRNVMVEKDGKPMFSGLTLKSEADLNRLTQTILHACGKKLEPEHPYVDGTLPDGSRVNVITAPLAAGGACITIRKFPAHRFAIDDLVKGEMMDARIGQFLKACVAGKLNILIVGGTGSGKTTLLNALAQQIPKAERVITIEDTLELSIPHANHVRLLSHGGVSARELLANSLRMRPDRIIVGECRRGETFDMLQAMNTGHSGSMTTIHANSPRDGLFRLETLYLMAGIEVPLLALRKQMNSALDLIIQIKRFRSGKRRITQICEVTGIEGDTITLQDLFTYESDNRLPHGAEAPGAFRSTGLVPTFLDRLADEGVEIPKTFFA